MNHNFFEHCGNFSKTLTARTSVIMSTSLLTKKEVKKEQLFRVSGCNHLTTFTQEVISGVMGGRRGGRREERERGAKDDSPTFPLPPYCVDGLTYFILPFSYTLILWFQFVNLSITKVTIKNFHEYITHTRKKKNFPTQSQQYFSLSLVLF